MCVYGVRIDDTTAILGNRVNVLNPLNEPQKAFVKLTLEFPLHHNDDLVVYQQHIFNIRLVLSLSQYSRCAHDDGDDNKSNPGDVIRRR